MREWFAVVCLCALLLAQGTISEAVQYRMTDLGTLPGGIYSYALGINNAGQIVGASYGARYEQHPVLWQNDQIQDLGLLPEFVGGPGAQALAINNHGQVVGWGQTGGGHTYACLWDHGVLQNLGTGRAFDINDNGLTVVDAGFWQAGVVRKLGSAPGALWSDANTVNNNGQAAGRSCYPGIGVIACLWRDGAFVNLGPGWAQGINDSGQVVGWQTDSSGKDSACLWQNGTATVLGPGDAYAINSKGWICGTSNGEAVVWARGTMIDLGPGCAFDINDNGWVCGQLYSGNAALWQPAPEPPAILVLLCGVSGTSVMMRLRRFAHSGVILRLGRD